MINRILIRIKVIQILYSFLLVEKQFSLVTLPETPTKEKRFAYSLYLDTLVLMLKVAESIGRRGGDKPLEETRFIKRLKSDDTIKSQLARYRMSPFPFEGIVESIADKVKESAVYKNYLKDRKENKFGVDSTVWNDIYNLVISRDAEVNQIISRRENFTLKAVDRTAEFLNETFTNFMASQDGGSEAITALHQSLDKARELYFRLLWLPVELTDMQERRLDDRRHKLLVTQEDLNPNLKFVDNSLVKAIRECETVRNFIEKEKISWEREDRVMMDNLLKSIIDSDIYRSYMDNPVETPKEDCELWRNIIRRIVFNNEHFLETLEDKSVFWNDDLDTIGTFVLKSFRKFEEGASADAVLDKYKDEEDARFGDELVKAVLKNKDTYRGYIDDAVDRSLWESERLAFMDVVIIETALAEIFNFPKIPLNVTLNEYIEIAKTYSSAKSGGFVNGILGKIISHLQKEGVLLKK
ncbi:MAG: transcription antitermination protein NusB [Muribaculaceae bacterium]|nr:transcription antitermination protein NusB [Muribaculaceae bacterium]